MSSRSGEGRPGTWPGFERLVAALQRKLDPQARVQWNEIIVGRSGTRRQLDVTVRGRLGSTRLLVVVECKEYRKKVGIELVEAFISKLADVGAQKGILVVRTGFTRDALERAAHAGVVTAVLRPVRDADWEGYLRSVFLRVVSRVIVLSDISLLLADGREPHVSSIEQVEDALGKRAFLEDLVMGWLHANPWEEGAPIDLALDPPPRLLRDGEQPLVARIRCRARWEDGFVVETDQTRPEDWIFVRQLPKGLVEDEKHFFELAELQRAADTFAT